MKKLIISVIISTFLFGCIVGAFLFVSIDGTMMKNYDLYNCIYNNAGVNGFNQHPVMIQKIQDECVCFREHNYTNLLEVNCSK
jgi:hypothetical protein